MAKIKLTAEETLLILKKRKKAEEKAKEEAARKEKELKASKLGPFVGKKGFIVFRSDIVNIAYSRIKPDCSTFIYTPVTLSKSIKKDWFGVPYIEAIVDSDKRYYYSITAEDFFEISHELSDTLSHRFIFITKENATEKNLLAIVKKCCNIYIKNAQIDINYFQKIIKSKRECIKKLKNPELKGYKLTKRGK